MSTIAQITDAAGGWAGTSGMTNASRNPVLLGDINWLKKSDSSTVAAGVCIGTPAWNGSGAPAGVQYRAGALAPSVQQTILSQGQPGFSSVSTRGAISLFNRDGFWSGKTKGQAIDFLDSTAYEPQSITWRLGVNPDSYSDFQIVDSYRLEGRAKVVHPMVELTPAMALLDASKPANDQKYLGLGTALNSDDGTLHVAAGNSDLNVAAAERFRLLLWFKGDSIAASSVLFSTRNALTGTSAGMTAYLTSGGLLRFRMADGSTDWALLDTTDYIDGSWHVLQVWEASDVLHGRCDNSTFSTSGVSTSGRGAITNTNTARAYELTGGGSPFTGVVTGIYFATGSGIGYSVDLRKQHQNGPPSPRETGCQLYWGFGSATGTTAQHAYDQRTEAVVALPKNTAVTGSATTREIDFGNNYNKDLTSGGDSFTLTIWARSLATGAAAGLFGKKTDTAAGSAGYLIRWSAADALIANLSDGSNAATITAADTNRGNGCWAFYVLRVNAAAAAAGGLAARSADLYRFDSSGTVATQIGSTADISALGDTTDAGVNLLAGEFGSGASPFNGDIGPMAIYSSVITTAKLAQLSQIHPTKADEATLDSLWKVDEGTGTSIADSVGAVTGTMGAGGSWVTRDGTITPGTATGWVSTLTGGYRRVNNLDGGGGLSKGQGYGLVQDAPVVWLDNIGHDYTAIDAMLTNAIVGQFNAGDYACEPLVADTETNRVVVKEKGVVATEGTDYIAVLADGLIYWDVGTTFPDPDITVDFKGMKFNSGAYDDHLGLITREWMTNTNNGAALTTGEFPAASASAFDADFPYPVGVYIPAGKAKPRTIEQQLRNDFAAPGLFTSTSLAGDTFHLMRALGSHPDSFTADIALTDKVLVGVPQELDPPKPVRELSVGYAKRQSSEEYSYAVIPGSTVAGDDGRDLTIKTPLQNHSDAMAWGQTVLTALIDPLLFEVTIARYQWQVFLARAGRSYPDVVSVQSAYASKLSSAVKFFCMGVVYDPARASSGWRVTLQLFRPSS